MLNVVAYSGGKDSTALALRLHEMGEPFALLHTPTGNELPGVADHIRRIAAVTGTELIFPEAPTLANLIAKYNALPNHRQRWCTREIKIEPCIRWFKAHPDATLLVGLRADEPERRGLYGDLVTVRYPLREWGWSLADVRASVGGCVPERTDCAVCPFQGVGDWFRLWERWPEEWARGEAWETQTGHTFRSPGRDTWPQSMAGMREHFERGRRPRGWAPSLFAEERRCRVCSL